MIGHNYSLKKIKTYQVKQNVLVGIKEHNTTLMLYCKVNKCQKKKSFDRYLRIPFICDKIGNGKLFLKEKCVLVCTLLNIIKKSK